MPRDRTARVAVAPPMTQTQQGFYRTSTPDGGGPVASTADARGGYSPAMTPSYSADTSESGYPAPSTYGATPHGTDAVTTRRELCAGHDAEHELRTLRLRRNELRISLHRPRMVRIRPLLRQRPIPPPRRQRLSGDEIRRRCPAGCNRRVSRKCDCASHVRRHTIPGWSIELRRRDVDVRSRVAIRFVRGERDDGIRLRHRQQLWSVHRRNYGDVGHR